MFRSRDHLDAQDLARLNKLAKTANSDPPSEYHYSRKTKRVSVSVQTVKFSIRLMRLDEAIDTATRLSDGSDPLESLLEGFLHVRQQYGHLIDGTKKPRGYSSGADFLYRLKYAAAWTYHMLSRSEEKRPSQVNATVTAAEKELRFNDGWRKPRSFEWRVCLTALLVESAFGTMRRGAGFKKRTYNTDNFNPRNWHRDYIKPCLRNVQRKNPATLDRLGNAYLRFVFEVYRRRKDSPDVAWHFNPQCPNWPEIDYIESRSVRPEHLCLQCRILKAIAADQRSWWQILAGAGNLRG